MIRNSRVGKALVDAVSKGYKISESGTLTNPKGKILTGNLDNGGYRCISYLYEGRATKLYHHQLQAYTKFGDEVFENECTRHLDSDPENNRWGNILIGSSKENSADRTPETVKRVTESVVAARRKLTDKQCIDVFNMLDEGCTQAYICLKYGLNNSTLSMILSDAEYYKNAIKDLDAKPKTGYTFGLK